MTDAFVCFFVIADKWKRMEELNNGQYQLVNIDNDELKRIYPNYEFVINDSSVQYGQQQVIQVQSPEQVAAHQQQMPQVQIYQSPENRPQFVQVQSDDGVVQAHQIVYHQVTPGMQQEETVTEPQYILELQTPQEQQAAAYKQQIHLQQQQQAQVQQAPPPPAQQQQQVVINQPAPQMQNQQQVILHSPQQILVHQQPNTPQPTQHYYVAQQPQYFIPQQQPQQDPGQQVQTRIVTYQSPSQNYQIQQPPQRIVFQQRQPTQLLQGPPVRPQQIVQQQQVTPSGLRIVARPGQMQGQIQRLPQAQVRQFFCGEIFSGTNFWSREIF